MKSEAIDPLIDTADELIAAMHGGRDVYEAYHEGRIPTGRYYLTNSQGRRVAFRAIQEAIARGEILPSYPDITAGSWSLPSRARDNYRRWEEHQKKKRDRASPPAPQEPNP